MDKLSIDTDIILGTELMDIHALILTKKLLPAEKSKKKKNLKRKIPSLFQRFLSVINPM
jgi:hypothetical protein